MKTKLILGLGAIGTALFSYSVNVLAEETLALEESPKSEATEIVISNPLQPSLLNYGKAATVFTKDELDNRVQASLGETIGLAPGVSSTFFGQAASRPIIRGFGGERVRVLKNGVGTGDVSDISEDHPVMADPLQAKQIEILRGPETLFYGSNAIGGAINVSDDSIPERSFKKAVQGEVLSQFGSSADNEKTFAGRLQGRIGDFNWNLSGFSRNTDDYEVAGSKNKVLNSDTESRGGTLGGSYIWNGGFLGISGELSKSNYGVPGEEDEVVRIDAKQHRFDLKGRVDDPSDLIESIKFKSGFSRYTHDEIEGGEVGTTFDRDSFESRIEIVHNPIGSLRGAAGLQFSYDDFSVAGDEAFLVPTKTTAPALFVFEQLPLSYNSKLEFGGRIEASHVEPDGLNSKNYVPFSLSLGPVWDLGSSGYNVGATFAYTQRAPTSTELFADGVHVARQIFELGDSDLDKESSWGIDLSLRKNDGPFTGAITPFYQRFDNYINLAGTGDEEEGFPVFSYQGVGAYFWGVEIEAAVAIDEIVSLGTHGLRFEYQFDFVRARDTDSSDDLPRIPPLRNILRARYSFNEKFEALIEGVFTSKQDEVSIFESQTSGYSLLNAEASIKTAIFGDRESRIFVRGTNLTDEEARFHTSFLKDEAPLRGRAVLAGLRFVF